jgi:hypothetical protein
MNTIDSWNIHEKLIENLSYIYIVSSFSKGSLFSNMFKNVL